MQRHGVAGSAGDVSHRLRKPACQLQLRRDIGQPHRLARVNRDDDAGLHLVLERADDQLAGTMAGRRAPVYVADVVARQVGAEFAELEALSALTNEVRTRDRSAIALAQPQPVAIELGGGNGQRLKRRTDARARHSRSPWGP